MSTCVTKSSMENANSKMGKHEVLSIYSDDRDSTSYHDKPKIKVCKKGKNFKPHISGSNRRRASNKSSTPSQRNDFRLSTEMKIDFKSLYFDYEKQKEKFHKDRENILVNTYSYYFCKDRNDFYEKRKNACDNNKRSSSNTNAEDDVERGDNNINSYYYRHLALNSVHFNYDMNLDRHVNAALRRKSPFSKKTTGYTSKYTSKRISSNNTNHLKNGKCEIYECDYNDIEMYNRNGISAVHYERKYCLPFEPNVFSRNFFVSDECNDEYLRHICYLKRAGVPDDVIYNIGNCNNKKKLNDNENSSSYNVSYSKESGNADRESSPMFFGNVCYFWRFGGPPPHFVIIKANRLTKKISTVKKIPVNANLSFIAAKRMAKEYIRILQEKLKRRVRNRNKLSMDDDTSSNLVDRRERFNNTAEFENFLKLINDEYKQLHVDSLPYESCGSSDCNSDETIDTRVYFKMNLEDVNFDKINVEKYMDFLNNVEIQFLKKRNMFKDAFRRHTNQCHDNGVSRNDNSTNTYYKDIKSNVNIVKEKNICEKNSVILVNVRQDSVIKSKIFVFKEMPFVEFRQRRKEGESNDKERSKKKKKKHVPYIKHMSQNDSVGTTQQPCRNNNEENSICESESRNIPTQSVDATCYFKNANVLMETNYEEKNSKEDNLNSASDNKTEPDISRDAVSDDVKEQTYLQMNVEPMWEKCVDMSETRDHLHAELLHKGLDNIQISNDGNSCVDKCKEEKEYGDDSSKYAPNLSVDNVNSNVDVSHVEHNTDVMHAVKNKPDTNISDPLSPTPLLPTPLLPTPSLPTPLLSTPLLPTPDDVKTKERGEMEKKVFANETEINSRTNDKETVDKNREDKWRNESKRKASIELKRKMVLQYKKNIMKFIRLNAHINAFILECFENSEHMEKDCFQDDIIIIDGSSTKQPPTVPHYIYKLNTFIRIRFITFGHLINRNHKLAEGYVTHLLRSNVKCIDDYLVGIRWVREVFAYNYYICKIIPKDATDGTLHLIGEDEEDTESNRQEEDNKKKLTKEDSLNEKADIGFPLIIRKGPNNYKVTHLVNVEERVTRNLFCLSHEFYQTSLFTEKCILNLFKLVLLRFNDFMDVFTKTCVTLDANKIIYRMSKFLMPIASILDKREQLLIPEHDSQLKKQKADIDDMQKDCVDLEDSLKRKEMDVSMRNTINENDKDVIKKRYNNSNINERRSNIEYLSLSRNVVYSDEDRRDIIRGNGERRSGLFDKGVDGDNVISTKNYKNTEMDMDKTHRNRNFSYNLGNTNRMLKNEIKKENRVNNIATYKEEHISLYKEKKLSASLDTIYDKKKKCRVNANGYDSNDSQNSSGFIQAKMRYKLRSTFPNAANWSTSDGSTTNRMSEEEKNGEQQLHNKCENIEPFWWFYYFFYKNSCLAEETSSGNNSESEDQKIKYQQGGSSEEYVENIVNDKDKVDIDGKDTSGNCNKDTISSGSGNGNDNGSGNGHGNGNGSSNGSGNGSGSGSKSSSHRSNEMCTSVTSDVGKNKQMIVSTNSDSNDASSDIYNDMMKTYEATVLRLFSPLNKNIKVEYVSMIDDSVYDHYIICNHKIYPLHYNSAKIISILFPSESDTLIYLARYNSDPNYNFMHTEYNGENGGVCRLQYIMKCLMEKNSNFMKHFSFGSSLVGSKDIDENYLQKILQEFHSRYDTFVDENKNYNSKIVDRDLGIYHFLISDSKDVSNLLVGSNFKCSFMNDYSQLKNAEQEKVFGFRQLRKEDVDANMYVDLSSLFHKKRSNRRDGKEVNTHTNGALLGDVYHGKTNSSSSSNSSSGSSEEMYDECCESMQQKILDILHDNDTPEVSDKFSISSCENVNELYSSDSSFVSDYIESDVEMDYSDGADKNYNVSKNRYPDSGNNIDNYVQGTDVSNKSNKFNRETKPSISGREGSFVTTQSMLDNNRKNLSMIPGDRSADEEEGVFTVRTWSQEARQGGYYDLFLNEENKYNGNANNNMHIKEGDSGATADNTDNADNTTCFSHIHTTDGNKNTHKGKCKSNSSDNDSATKQKGKNGNKRSRSNMNTLYMNNGNNGKCQHNHTATYNGTYYERVVKNFDEKVIPMWPLPTGVYFDASRKLWRCQWKENGKFRTKGFSLANYGTLENARKKCILYKCSVANIPVNEAWLRPNYISPTCFYNRKFASYVSEGMHCSNHTCGLKKSNSSTAEQGSTTHGLFKSDNSDTAKSGSELGQTEKRVRNRMKRNGKYKNGNETEQSNESEYKNDINENKNKNRFLKELSKGYNADIALSVVQDFVKKQKKMNLSGTDTQGGEPFFYGNEVDNIYKEKWNENQICDESHDKQQQDRENKHSIQNTTNEPQTNQESITIEDANQLNELKSDAENASSVVLKDQRKNILLHDGDITNNMNNKITNNFNEKTTILDGDSGARVNNRYGMNIQEINLKFEHLLTKIAKREFARNWNSSQDSGNMPVKCMENRSKGVILPTLINSSNNSNMEKENQADTHKKETCFQHAAVTDKSCAVSNLKIAENEDKWANGGIFNNTEVEVSHINECEDKKRVSACNQNYEQMQMGFLSLKENSNRNLCHENKECINNSNTSNVVAVNSEESMNNNLISSAPSVHYYLNESLMNKYRGGNLMDGASLLSPGEQNKETMGSGSYGSTKGVHISGPHDNNNYNAVGISEDVTEKDISENRTEQHQNMSMNNSTTGNRQTGDDLGFTSLFQDIKNFVKYAKSKEIESYNNNMNEGKWDSSIPPIEKRNTVAVNSIIKRLNSDSNTLIKHNLCSTAYDIPNEERAKGILQNEKTGDYLKDMINETNSVTDSNSSDTLNGKTVMQSTIDKSKILNYNIGGHANNTFNGHNASCMSDRTDCISPLYFKFVLGRENGMKAVSYTNSNTSSMQLLRGAHVLNISDRYVNMFPPHSYNRSFSSNNLEFGNSREFNNRWGRFFKRFMPDPCDYIYSNVSNGRYFGKFKRAKPCVGHMQQEFVGGNITGTTKDDVCNINKNSGQMEEQKISGGCNDTFNYSEVNAENAANNGLIENKNEGVSALASNTFKRNDEAFVLKNESAGKIINRNNVNSLLHIPNFLNSTKESNNISSANNAVKSNNSEDSKRKNRFDFFNMNTQINEQNGVLHLPEGYFSNRSGNYANPENVKYMHNPNFIKYENVGFGVTPNNGNVMHGMPNIGSSNNVNPVVVYSLNTYLGKGQFMYKQNMNATSNETNMHTVNNNENDVVRDHNEMAVNNYKDYFISLLNNNNSIHNGKKNIITMENTPQNVESEYSIIDRHNNCRRGYDMVTQFPDHKEMTKLNGTVGTRNPVYDAFVESVKRNNRYGLDMSGNKKMKVSPAAESTTDQMNDEENVESVLNNNSSNGTDKTDMAFNGNLYDGRQLNGLSGNGVTSCNGNSYDNKNIGESSRIGNVDLYAMKRGLPKGIYFDQTKQLYRVQYVVDDSIKTKGFSVKKLGHIEARREAEAFRNFCIEQGYLKTRRKKSLTFNDVALRSDNQHSSFWDS